MKSGIVTIIGRPNSGKSTLLNSLLGQKISIVSARPQTTRHSIRGVLNEPRGQVVFVDTPGIHKPGYRMNERMLHSAYSSLDSVDLVLLLVDGSASFGAGENFVLDVLKRLSPRALLLINKIDKIEKTRLLPIMDRYSKEYEFLEIIPLSALTAENLPLLVETIFKHLPEGEPLYDPEYLTDRSERFLASEFIREKILERTREELPYATGVVIRSFDETFRASKNHVRIEADILVEKRSQQGIIVGTGGTFLRDLGTSARLALEQFLGCRVYLGLRVITVPKWRDRDTVLDEMELER
jgi:GTP-binding protein Era